MAGNVDLEAKRDYVDRLFNVEREFGNARDERNDFRKDLKEEIKSKGEATGIEFAEVDRLVKIKLDEEKTRDRHALDEQDLATFDILYGSPGTDDELS